MQDCIFCKIARGEIPSQKFFENDKMIVIADISPQAVKHYLMIPKMHYTDITDWSAKAPEVLGDCFKIIAGLSHTLGLSKGFRMITNQGTDGCQSVPHVHVHILGGNKLSEKMG